MTGEHSELCSEFPARFQLFSGERCFFIQRCDFDSLVAEATIRLDYLGEFEKSFRKFFSYFLRRSPSEIMLGVLSLLCVFSSRRV